MDIFDWLLKKFINLLVNTDIELVFTVEGDQLVVRFRHMPKAKTISFILEGKEITMLEMTDSQKATLTLAIKDAKGFPAKVDGMPVWSSSNEDVATVSNISADGLSADVLGGGPGLCQITVTADADLGAGTKEITGFLDVTINPGEAVVVELSASAPVEQ